MKKRIMLTLCGVLSAFATTLADDVNYSGTVVTKNGEPIMGATVTVTGTTVSTMTDMDGRFSLVVPDGYNTVTVTYSGMKKQTVNVQREPVVLYANPEQAAEASLAKTKVPAYKPVKAKKPWKKNVFNLELGVGGASGGDWADMSDDIQHASLNLGWRHNYAEWIGWHVIDAGVMALTEEAWNFDDLNHDSPVYTLSTGLYLATPRLGIFSIFASCNVGAAYVQGDDGFYPFLRPRAGINIGKFYMAYRYDWIDRSSEYYDDYHYYYYRDEELPSISQHSFVLGFNF